MTLSDDELALVDELRREYGAHLYDYLRADLGAEQARLAVAGTLLSALRHATRPAQPDQLRAWLYGVARAHRTMAAQPGGEAPADGACSRPAPLAGSLGQALACLPAADREVLTLAGRHGLTADEVAVIFDMDTGQVETLLAAAADRLEACAAAISAASTGTAAAGCQEVTDLLSPGAVTATSGEEISRHVSTCRACQDAPRRLSAGQLPLHLPIQAAPDGLTDQLALADPLPDDEQLWRADGFPLQIRPLVATPPDKPTSNASAEHAEYNPPPDDADDFRAWEQRSRAAEEFWAVRPDESNPEAHLSLRPMLPALRVGSLIIAVVVAIGIAGAAWSVLHPAPPTTVTQAAAPRPAKTITLIPTEPLSELPLQEPPTLTPTAADPSPRRIAAPTIPPGPASTPRQSPRSTTAAATVTASTRPTKPAGPDEPPRRTTRPKSSPSKKALPKPAAPAANVSPSSISLGSGRNGSISLSVSPGTGQVVSATGSSGISVSGTRFSVSAPQEKPGCSDTTESGTISLTWRGTNTGDGRTSAGTTSGGGTITVHVTWTVKADQGYWIPRGSVGPVGPGGDGQWSNCPNGR